MVDIGDAEDERIGVELHYVVGGGNVVAYIDHAASNTIQFRPAFPFRPRMHVKNRKTINTIRTIIDRCSLAYLLILTQITLIITNLIISVNRRVISANLMWLQQVERARGRNGKNGRN